MGDAYRCDHCGRVTERHGVVGWLRVTVEGVNITTFGESREDRLFCCPVCLWLYFREKHGDEHAHH